MKYESEIHMILKLNEKHYSATKIVKTINKNHKVIMNLLKDFDNYGKKSCGRPQCLTTQNKRAVILIVSNSSLTPRQIAEKLKLEKC